MRVVGRGDQQRDVAVAELEEVPAAAIAGVEIARPDRVEVRMAEGAIDQDGRRKARRKAGSRSELVLRGDDEQAVDPARDQRLDPARLGHRIFAARHHQHLVAALRSDPLPLADEAGEELVAEVGDDDADGARLAAPEARRHVVGLVAERRDRLEHGATSVAGHAARARKRVRDGRRRHAGARRDVADRRRSGRRLRQAGMTVACPSSPIHRALRNCAAQIRSTACHLTAAVHRASLGHRPIRRALAGACEPAQHQSPLPPPPSISWPVIQRASLLARKATMSAMSVTSAMRLKAL